MKGYKAFDKNWRCRGFQYEIGKTYELSSEETLKICECGFHFCKNPIDVFGYYPMNDNTMIAEVEALGEIQQEGTKYCTDKIKIVKEFTRQELQNMILNGSYNSGHGNTGDYNSGDFNTGSHNSGNYNAGNFNAGNFNSGYFNSGDGNSGDCNSGDYNSGLRNSGDGNTGDYNSGDFNTGNFNSGNFNSGYFNSGDYNAGIFNTTEPYMRAFNRETRITFSEFTSALPFGFYNLCSRIKTGRLLRDDYTRIKMLPNFDPVIFKEITGIDIEDEKNFL